MIESAVRQPVTVAVGVILMVLAGVVALQRIPIQLTPNVEDTIVSVSTTWEGASPLEIEQEIVDEQEDKLLGLSNLKAITSSSQQGVGTIRLEFKVGTEKAEALREVSDKLRQVPDYPDDADEPVIEASDPDNRDFIAWVVLESSDDALDIRDLQDFVDDRIVPILERVPGMAEVNALGGREREVEIRFDPVKLAKRGVTVEALVLAIRGTNQNRSAGDVAEAKSDVRLRMVSQYTKVREVEDTVIAETAGGPVRVSDVASVVETFKEPRSFVRSRGHPVIAVNFQREIGTNVMEVMEAMQAELARLNAPDGLLERHARELGLDGDLRLTQVYDQTIYIDDALALVTNDIWLGGALAMGVLLLYLRSLRSAGIIAFSIPISVAGAIVAMVAMGRSVNVVSLAGISFAVGMVIDNAITVLENVFRHLEMGKHPFEATVTGTREVFGALLASTVVSVCSFVPILLIQEEVGQLFRDISLAIVAAVALSLLVCMTVIPACTARFLRAKSVDARAAERSTSLGFVGGLVYRLCGSTVARVVLVTGMAALSIFGTWALMPPTDYLPTGNRNLVFGLMIPPPGYNLEQRSALGARIEEGMRPFWEAGLFTGDPEKYESAKQALPEVATFDFATMQPGPAIVPPPLENYFLVAFEDILFHGGISAEPEKVSDLLPLFAHATRPEVAPGVMAFAFQVPLFQLGGRSGSAVKIDFAGDDLVQVSDAALAVFLEMMGRYGPGATQPDPSNFNVYGPELQVVPDLVRLSETGLTPAALGLAVQAFGDGAIVGDFRSGGQAIDLKLVTAETPDLGQLSDKPLATPRGDIVPLSSVAVLQRVNAAAQINRVSRQRSVTLQFTPQGIPLEQALDEIAGLLEAKRDQGVIPHAVETSFSGSASKLAAVRTAMLGDGTLAGTLSSSLLLALLVTYLVMCVLFQSFLQPAVIMFSVPLATLGGFAALRLVHMWSISDRHMPVQNLDVLTMLGFVILIGIVVNNAILIVHQSLHFMRGESEVEGGDARVLAPREAIAEATKSRVRPILMSALTSIGGLAPLVFMPGSGSELYRGLGAVVLGGLIVSTVFTLLLVPLLLSLVCDVQQRLTKLPAAVPARFAGAGLVLLALGLVALGCRSATQDADLPPASPELAGLSTGARDAELARLGGADAPAREPRFAPAPVLEFVAPVRDELEALGGPDVWRALDPMTGVDLLGAQPRRIALGLERCLLDLEAHNVALSRARLAPRISREEIASADAAFDPVFFSGAEFENVDRPTPIPRIFDPGTMTFTTIGAGENRSRRSSVTAGLRRRLDAGATLEASTFVEKFDNRTSGISFDPDPAWRSGVALSLEQPLLRGYGEDVNRGEVAIAENRTERDLQLLRAERSAIAAGAEVAYWDLYEAWQRVRILEALAGDGEEVERVLRERQDFDAEPAEYSDALATVESRRAEVVRAGLTLRLASDRLKGIVQSPDYPPGSEVLVEPADRPREDPLAIQAHAALGAALRDRGEPAAALTEIEDEKIRERVARSFERPDLSLVGQVSVLGEDTSAANASEELDDFVSYLVGLTFELPLENRAARADLRRARLSERAAVLRYEQAVLDVVLDVKAVLRELEASYALIGATRSLRIAQTENLRTLSAEEALRRELSPEFLALKFQRQQGLAQAQLDELAALCDYNRALASYSRALGAETRGTRSTAATDG